MLQAELCRFVELLFMKLLPTGSTTYKIVIQKPVFSNSGMVQNTQGKYAEILLKHDDVDINELKSGQSNSILNIAKSSLSVDKLFKDFPY
jgi:hypothetical protein